MPSRILHDVHEFQVDIAEREAIEGTGDPEKEQKVREKIKSLKAQVHEAQNTASNIFKDLEGNCHCEVQRKCCDAASHKTTSVGTGGENEKENEVVLTASPNKNIQSEKSRESPPKKATSSTQAGKKKVSVMCQTDPDPEIMGCDGCLLSDDEELGPAAKQVATLKFDPKSKRLEFAKKKKKSKVGF